MRFAVGWAQGYLALDVRRAIASQHPYDNAAN